MYVLDPTWSDIAEKYEYFPDVSFYNWLSTFEEELGDDPKTNGWNKVTIKRKSHPRLNGPDHEAVK